MTTTVKITSPDSNQENLRVERVVLDENNQILSRAAPSTLTDGETLTEYVYGGIGFLITEVRKNNG